MEGVCVTFCAIHLMRLVVSQTYNQYVSPGKLSNTVCFRVLRSDYPFNQLLTIVIYKYFIDYVLMVDAGQLWHNWTQANMNCQQRLGTTLGTITSWNPDMLGYQTLTNSHGLSQVPCWLGAYQISATNNDNWEWIDGSSFTLNSSFYNFNSADQQCGYWYPFLIESKGYVNDWFCANESRQVGTDDFGYHSVAYCWICNKPDRYNYTITLRTANSATAKSPNTIYFRIKGNIENTTYENETWTEWFTSDIFRQNNETFVFVQELTYVGDPVELIVLTQLNNGLGIIELGVNDQYYQFSSLIFLKYSDGV